MVADHDLRLAWIAHRSGNFSRRDVLLTLAVAAAEPEGAAWVVPVRDFLVNAHPGHLYDGFYHLDEALADRRVMAALKSLRTSFPESRVRSMLQREDVARGPYTGRKSPAVLLLDDMLAAPEKAKTRRLGKLGAASIGVDLPEIPATEPPGSILAFYLNVLLGVATLCSLVLEGACDDKRAA